MRLPVLITSCLLLLIAAFPCYQVGIVAEDNQITTRLHWMFFLNEQPRHYKLRLFPKESAVHWPLMFAEILGAFAVGGIVWAMQSPARRRSESFVIPSDDYPTPPGEALKRVDRA